jgi:hypothetical protein
MAFKLRSPAFAPGGDGPKPHRLERREGLGGDVAPRCPEHAGHEGHVLEDGAAGQELGILEHDADGAPQAGDLSERRSSVTSKPATSMSPSDGGSAP